MFIAKVASDKFMTFFLFSEKIDIDISCESSFFSFEMAHVGEGAVKLQNMITTSLLIIHVFHLSVSFFWF